VDRLLASPHYGERMAQMWLDLARYGETQGYHHDRHRDMWRWRDGVIRAFNETSPTTGSRPNNWPATSFPTLPRPASSPAAFTATK
jgi:hypothetical protein